MERTVYNADKMYTYIRGYASGVGMIPVSYTHLDVYKRQGLSVPDENGNDLLGEYSGKQPSGLLYP